MKNEQMALLFSEATPYIQKYHGKTLVIKYGGNAMVNDELKLAVMNDLVTLTLLGVRVVLVHGGGCVQAGGCVALGEHQTALSSRCWPGRSTRILLRCSRGAVSAFAAWTAT